MFISNSIYDDILNRLCRLEQDLRHLSDLNKNRDRYNLNPIDNLKRIESLEEQLGVEFVKSTTRTHHRPKTGLFGFKRGDKS